MRCAKSRYLARLLYLKRDRLHAHTHVCVYLSFEELLSFFSMASVRARSRPEVGKKLKAISSKTKNVCLKVIRGCDQDRGEIPHVKLLTRG